LPIADCRLPIKNLHFNRKSKIANQKFLSGSLFRCVACAGRQRASLALPQLPVCASLQRSFVRAEAGASVERQHTLDFGMRSGDYVHTNQFTDSSGGGSACISRGFDRAHVSAHKDRDVTSADVLFSQELYVSGFDHCVSRFDRADEAFSLHHS
jgi:hypothetical protein